MTYRISNLKPENAQEQQKICEIIRAFIIACEPNGIDCMKLSQKMQVRWGLFIDWHDCATALDMLATSNEITRHGHNDYGNSVYMAKVN
jgi:hypothetical protein